MRARRSAYEAAGAGFGLRPVVQRRDHASKPRRAAWLGLAGSALLHGGVLALLLIFKPGGRLGEAQNAPTFAVEYTAGAPEAAPPSPASQATVNLGGSDEPPPPPQDRSDEADALPLPPPRLHYGTALRQRATPNPFARLVPDDLAPSHNRPSSVGNPDSRYTAFAGGPQVHAGQLTDAITHPPGSEVSGDYDAELRAFVEAHKDEMRPSLVDSPEGKSVLQVTIDRGGTVTRVHLVAPSSSARLNEAWVGFFRGHHFPPLSADITGKDYTVIYELDYVMLDGPPG